MSFEGASEIQVTVAIARFVTGDEDALPDPSADMLEATLRRADVVAPNDLNRAAERLYDVGDWCHRTADTMFARAQALTRGISAAS